MNDHGAVRAEPLLLMSTTHCFALSGILFFGFLLGATARAADPPPPANDKPVTLDTDPHLVAWWKFDETAGTNAADSSSGRHPATIEGGASFDANSATGKLGKALKLDGKQQSLKVTDYKGVTGPRPRTVAAWIKTNKPGGEIVSWGLEDFGNMFIMCFIRDRVGVTPRGGYLYMKAATHDNAWHHVAAVVHQADPPNLHDNVKIYKDGELAEIDDIGLLDLWPVDTGDKLDVRIGRRFQGLIDDLRIYDRALSDEEIAALFKLQSDRPLGKP